MKTYNLWLTAFLFTVFLLVNTPCPVSAQTTEYAKVSNNAAVDNFDVDEEISFDEENIPISDPFEKYNRFMFKVNDWVYRKVFNPLTKGYDFITPKCVQKSFYNLFENARSTIPFFNNLFQQKYQKAATVFGRFAVNSTVGVGGLFDPAQKYLHWTAYEEDFGQTLGYYGMEPGPYIMLPLMGPSTGRDVIGLIGDMAFNPFTWLIVCEAYPKDVFTHLPYLHYVNAYAYKQRENYETVMDGAIAPYAALQNFYVQIRRSKIKE